MSGSYSTTTSGGKEILVAVRRAGVDSLLGRLGMSEEWSRTGDEIVFECLACGRPKMWVNSRTGYWTCHRCKAGGNFADLVELRLGISRDSAVAWVLGEDVESTVASDLHGRLSEIVATDDGEDGGVNLPREAVRVREGTVAWEYLEGRGIGSRTVEAFDVRWCRTGFWGGRIVVPVPDVDGRQLTFVARTMGDSEPKYLYPRGAKTSRALLGCAPGDEVVLVEGSFDAMSWHGAGVPAVSILGSSLSKVQRAAVIGRWRQVTIAMDGDQAGRRAAKKMVGQLSGLVDLRVARLPKGTDPGDVDPGDVLPGKRVRSKAASVRLPRV